MGCIDASHIGMLVKTTWATPDLVFGVGLLLSLQQCTKVVWILHTFTQEQKAVQGSQLYVRVATLSGSCWCLHLQQIIC